MILMAMLEDVEFLSLEKTEDQLVLGAFVFVLLSFYFGLQEGSIYLVLWGAFGGAALICIFFAFPNMWPYALLLYASYAIIAFGLVFMIFWGTALDFFGMSIPMLAGAFFFAAAIYIDYYIVQNIKKVRDVVSKKKEYVPLGFWSISVILFTVFSALSILGWALWAGGSEGPLQMYVILEPVIAFLLVYILWIPERNLDWSVRGVPESPGKRFITLKSRALKDMTIGLKNECPECGKELRLEKKSCPSCGNAQNFGWCPSSEAYALPCAKCGELSLLGKEKCDKCGQVLSSSVTCNTCKKTTSVRDWPLVT